MDFCQEKRVCSYQIEDRGQNLLSGSSASHDPKIGQLYTRLAQRHDKTEC